MDWAPASAARWLFDADHGPAERQFPRWIFLRALGLIYFSAFYSFFFQVRGLIGPQGILPADAYLQAVAHSFGGYTRFWFAPTLLWFSSSSHALTVLCWAGLVASLLLTLDLWPRGMLVVCFLCFLSFIAAAQDFSSYQSDGMLLEAGFVALFLAPRGFLPGWKKPQPVMRAAMFLLLWEWVRIYFESGVAKILGGDPEWRNFTAMDEYYQNGPLPTWIGWYAQHLPHWFHATATGATLVLELGLVWMLFLPRRWRIVCFCIVTPWEIGVILTANYAFLNYLVLALGFLLLDDRCIPQRVVRWSKSLLGLLGRNRQPEKGSVEDLSGTETRLPTRDLATESGPAAVRGWRDRINLLFARVKLVLIGIALSWVFYAATAELLGMIGPQFQLPAAPVAALEPFRIANRFGLFGIMTRGRYEIEFQGSTDRQNWIPYPFRYKPQDPKQPPGIYAPYQPRFDWNLWFASLGSWREYPIVPYTEERLLSNDLDVLALFAANPFPEAPPRVVRAVVWQYWFTSIEEKRTTGFWWRRQFLGLYAPALEREPDGRFGVVEWPSDGAPPQ